MAFNYLNWQRWSTGFDLLNNAMWNYTSTTDTLAVIQAANYFNSVNENPSSPALNVGDVIWVVGTDGQNFALVTAIVGGVVVAPFAVALGVGAVLTANIANLAVTAAQIANATITGAKMVNNTVTSTQLALNTIQYIQVAMTAAQWNGMSAAPFQILAAPGAGLIYQVDNVWYDMAFVAAQYAAGGVTNLQYANTAVGAGVPVTADTPAATITGLAASSIVRPGLSAVAMAQATTVNQGLFMSNKTGAFTTGDGTWKINVAYRIITA